MRSLTKVALSFFSLAKSCKICLLAVKRLGVSLSNMERRPSCQHITFFLSYDVTCYILVKCTSAASWTDIPPFAPG